MSNKSWIIGTLIAGVIFYTLCGKLSETVQGINSASTQPIIEAMELLNK